MSHLARSVRANRELSESQVSMLSDGSVTAQSGSQSTEPSPKKVPPPLNLDQVSI